MNTKGFCVFIDAVFEGPVPSVRDADERPVVFETQVEAEREIANSMIIRLQQFIAGVVTEDGNVHR